MFLSKSKSNSQSNSVLKLAPKSLPAADNAPKNTIMNFEKHILVAGKLIKIQSAHRQIKTIQ